MAYTDKKVLLFKRHKKTFWESLWIPYETDNTNRSSLIHKKEIESKSINIKHKLSHLNLDITVKLIKYKNIFDQHNRQIDVDTIRHIYTFNLLLNSVDPKKIKKIVKIIKK